MKRLIIAIIVAIILLVPTAYAFAAAGVSPSILMERIRHTPSVHDEAVAIVTDQPTYFEMLYCEGQTIPSPIDPSVCTWIMDEEWQKGFHARNIVLMTDLRPDTFYAYRIQLVNRNSLGVVTEQTFYNR